MAQVKCIAKRTSDLLISRLPALRVMTSARNANLSSIATKPKSKRRNSYDKI